MCGSWQDRFTPPAGEEDAELATSPDLGPLFEFQQKTPGACPGLERVHCFCYPAALSHGAATGDIPQISDGAHRLARGLAARLLCEDVDQHFAAMGRYDEPELIGDEWTPAAFPAYRDDARHAVTGWLLRRLAQAALVVLVMSLIVFVGVHAIGNPIDILIGRRQPAGTAAGHRPPRAGPAAVAPVPGLRATARCTATWAVFVYQEDAIGLILQRLPATHGAGAVGTLLLAVLVGMPLGLFAGMKPSIRWPALDGGQHPRLLAAGLLGRADADHGLRVQLGWLPASGRGATRAAVRRAVSLLTLDGLQHLLLPALNLALFKISLVIRLTRAGAREVLPQDYVQVRARQGPAPSARDAGARAAQHPDPARHRARAGVRLD